MQRSGQVAFVTSSIFPSREIIMPLHSSLTPSAFLPTVPSTRMWLFLRRLRPAVILSALVLCVAAAGGADGTTRPVGRAMPATDPRCSPGEPAPNETELAPFLEAGASILCVVAADLNGDALQDRLLVLERVPQHASDRELVERERSLLIAVRDSGGALRVVKRNDRIILCSTCGGAFGDPFDGLSADREAFTVHHYGGSAWRWAVTYTFRYVQPRDTWELIKVTEVSFHTGDPEGSVEEVISTAPADFQNIDIEDFHPEKWKESP